MYENNEMEIDLKDLIAYILHRWKGVAICAIAFAIIVGGYKSYSDYKKIKLVQDESEAGYKALTVEMTEEQISNSVQFLKRYNNYKARVADNQKYINNSVMMKINANAVSRYRVEYYIETGYADIISSFADSALDMDDYTKMAELFGEDIDPHYISELVSIGGSVAQDSFDIDTDKNGDIVKGNISNTYKGVLSVSVMANDKMTGEKIAAVVESAIKEHMDKLTKAGIEVEMSELTTTYTEVIDTTLAEYQRDKQEETSELITGFNTYKNEVKSTLDEKEYKLFEYLIRKQQQHKDHVHWKRWIAVGGAVGIVFGIILMAFNYICIPCVKTISDLARLHKYKELGVIIEPVKSKFFFGRCFHRWANKIEFSGLNRVSEGVAEDIISDRIAKIVKNAQKNKVLLVSDTNYSYTEMVVDNCMKLLEKKGIKAVVANPLSSVEALEELRNSDAVVMASTIKRSLPTSVSDIETVCEENNVPVIANFIVYPQA